MGEREAGGCRRSRDRKGSCPHDARAANGGGRVAAEGTKDTIRRRRIGEVGRPTRVAVTKRDYSAWPQSGHILPQVSRSLYAAAIKVDSAIVGSLIFLTMAAGRPLLDQE